MRRKEEGSKQDQTNKKHSTPKAVTFPKKNELPRVGIESTTLYTLDRALYHIFLHVYKYYIFTCTCTCTCIQLKTCIQVHVHVHCMYIHVRVFARVGYNIY